MNANTGLLHVSVFSLLVAVSKRRLVVIISRISFFFQVFISSCIFYKNTYHAQKLINNKKIINSKYFDSIKMLNDQILIVAKFNFATTKRINYDQVRNTGCLNYVLTGGRLGKYLFFIIFFLSFEMLFPLNWGFQYF